MTSGTFRARSSAPYAKWRGPKDNPGRLPDTAKLSALIQSLGIDSGTPVVVVYEGADATEFGAAARVVWSSQSGWVGECVHPQWRHEVLARRGPACHAGGRHRATVALRSEARYAADRHAG